ncbi:MAG: peroxiredoxin [Gammaproteobacteria bacterium]|nr:MAG: peroxiredoxin [Gammaproteobacteria bacterium]
MKQTVEHNKGMCFEATTQSGHKIIMDGSPEHGGQNKGVRPMELVLSAIGGCSSFDVILILKKSKQKITSCKVDISATRSDKVPAVFEKIQLDFYISGIDLSRLRVEKAVNLSVKKYCSVIKMLEQTVDIDYSLKIIEET